MFWNLSKGLQQSSNSVCAKQWVGFLVLFFWTFLSGIIPDPLSLWGIVGYIAWTAFFFLWVSTVSSNCLYRCQFRDMKPAVLPVQTCWQVANLPSLSLLCHLSPQTSEAPKGNFTWNFRPPCACVEYNIFSSMFWASLSVCRHMVQLVCMCVCLLPPNPLQSLISPLWACVAPPPFISVSLLHPRVCVSLCSHANLAQLQGKVCLRVFKCVCCHRYN